MKSRSLFVTEIGFGFVRLGGVDPSGDERPVLDVESLIKDLDGKYKAFLAAHRD
jgi:hypothetical protein